jgi:hypothetical protein
MAGAGQWAADDGGDDGRAALAMDSGLLPALMDELSFFAQDGPAAASAAAAPQHGRSASGGAAEARRGVAGAAPAPQRAPHADPGRIVAADADALLASCRDGRALLRELNERLLVRASGALAPRCTCIDAPPARRAPPAPLPRRCARC